jgi:adenylate cyclase class 2
MMKVINVEIKARCADHESIRRMLRHRKAEFIGKDHQVDTYFLAGSGRLKLREGTIENNLIWYRREDLSGPRTSYCRLFKTDSGSALKEILEQALGILVVVDKEREIYFVGNVKIHLDRVSGLGNFLEIEAQSEAGDLSEETLYRQCTGLMDEFGIDTGDLVSKSYSDLILLQQHEDHQRGTNRS